MAYCAQSDIEKLIPVLELAELTAESGSTVDAAVVTEVITKADAEIDSYCKRYYTVPFTATPAMIEALLVDIAVFHLYSRRSAVPEVRQYRYDNSIKFLVGVAAGEILVSGATAISPTTPEEAVDMENLAHAVQRVKESGYDISATDVSALLGITVTDPRETAGNESPQIESSESIFNRDNMTNW